MHYPLDFCFRIVLVLSLIKVAVRLEPKTADKRSEPWTQSLKIRLMGKTME